MSVVCTGTDIEMLSDVPSFNPTTGWTRVVTWTGLEDPIRAKANFYVNAKGWACSMSSDGPLWTLVATSINTSPTGDNDGTPVAQTSWSWSTEIVYEDWFSRAEVVSEAITYGNRGQYKKKIEAAAADNTALESPLSGYTYAPKIVDELTTGRTTYEGRQFNITRRRSFTEQYTERVQIDAGAKVYTRAAFISNFVTDSTVQAALPNNPTTAPTGYTWGFKERDYQVQYNGGSKLEEVTSWIFKLWPNAFNQIDP